MVIGLRLVDIIQLLCISIFSFTDLVKSIAQTGQWVMTLYAADPDLIISPRVIVAMGCIVYFFAMLDIAMDYWFPRDRRAA